MRLDGKVAIITGAGGGVGRASALRFAEEGAFVVCADVATEVNVETAELVVAAGGRAIAVTTDVTADAQVAELIGAAEEQFGGIDILFNNAGVMLGGDDDAVATPDDIIRSLVDLTPVDTADPSTTRQMDAVMR